MPSAPFSPFLFAPSTSLAPPAIVPQPPIHSRDGRSGDLAEARSSRGSLALPDRPSTDHASQQPPH